MPLLGGYGLPITNWDIFESHLRGESAYELTWKWIWDELHHQGDVGSASYFAACKLLRHYRAIGLASGNLVWFVYALNGRTKVHDDTSSFDVEFRYLKISYLTWAMTDLKSFSEFETIKGLLGIIAQEADNKKLADLLDFVDADNIDTLLDR